MKTSLTDFFQYQPKLILISLLIISPIIIMGYLFYSDIEKRIQILQDEQLGLSYIKQLKPLLEKIPKHRGLSMAFLSGNQSFQSEMSIEQQEIDTLFVQLEDWQKSLVQTKIWQGKIHKEIYSFNKQWNQIKRDLLKHSPEQTFKIQSQLLGHIIDGVKLIDPDSGLLVDGKQGGQLLMELVVK